MVANTRKQAKRGSLAVALVMVLQAIMPWSWVHAQMMSPDISHDMPPCHSVAMGEHHLPATELEHSDEASSHDQQAQSVCERACALSQTALLSSAAMAQPEIVAGSIAFISSRYFSYTPKVPTPPPNA